jgi:AcrR family transcriptional regulator
VAIVSTAVALADRGGIAAVTMRGVAARLGVEAMSLYHHVADKQALLGAASERVWAGVASETSGSWQDSVRTIALSAHHVLLEHAWVLEVASSAGGTERMRVIEALLGQLARAGLPPADIYEGYHLIDGLILGYTAQEASYRRPVTLGADESSIPDDFVQVREHASAHTDPARDRSSTGLEWGLDLALNALARKVRS